MKRIEHDLSTGKYTRVYHEDEADMEYGAPHHFEVVHTATVLGSTIVGEVDFQCGAINEVGVNGVMNEDLIAMVITRLEYFNKTEFACRENAMAITKLEEALLWLRKRTIGRENRGVEGTHKK